MTFFEIRALAAQAHGSQMYGNRPYIVHLDAVYALRARYMLPLYENDAGVWAAYFHDALEDTSLTEDSLRGLGCPADAATAVLFCTDESGETRRVRKAATYARVSRALHEHQFKANIGLDLGIETKLCDRIANIEECLKDQNSSLLGMYRKEHSKFRETYCLPGHLPEMWFDLDAMLMSQR